MILWYFTGNARAVELSPPGFTGYNCDNIGIQIFSTTPELFEEDVTADPDRYLESIAFSKIQIQPIGFTRPPVPGIFGISGSVVPEPTSMTLVAGLAAGWVAVAPPMPSNPA